MSDRYARGVEVEARWRAAGVLVVTMRGRQDGDSIGRLLELCRERFLERAPRAVLFDATAVDGFSADLRQPAVELLKLVRASGLTRGVAAVTSGGVRMMGAAIAFAAGLPLEFVESVEAAERRIDELLRA